MKTISNEVKIAIVAIVGAIILFFGLNFLKGIKIFSSRNSYFIRFSNVSGLSSSTPIFANGYKVGSVRSIVYDYTQDHNIIVQADLNENIKLPIGSKAEIIKDIMGNIQIDLVLAENNNPLIQPGDTIFGRINGGAVDQLKGLMPYTEKIVPKVDSITTNLNKILEEKDIIESIKNLKATTQNLTKATQELTKLTITINQKLPAITENARQTMQNTNQFTQQLKQVDVQGTMQKVDQIATNLKNLSDDLNQNKGTLGLLMKDPSIYKKLQQTIESADTLLKNIKDHPKRYVHFSVFGCKSN